jgi:hypothetical protein
MRERDGLDACGPGARESGRVRAIGDDDGDLRVQPSVRDGVDQRLQVAPPPGDEHRDPPVGGRGVRPHSARAGPARTRRRWTR